MTKQKPRQKRKLSPKMVRIGIVIWALLIVGLLIFAEIIRPNQDAAAYTKRLDSSSKPLEKCFEKLSETTQLQVYYAPDIALNQKKSDMATIRKQIGTCRQELTDFNKTAHGLTGFRLAGYTSTYRTAKVNQRQAYDVIGQSNDVMNQYDRLANFLNTYYDHMAKFQEYATSLSELDTFVVTADKGKELTDQAKDLRARAATIRKLDAPAEFNSTKQATADMLEQAATGFDNVAFGYLNGNDYYTTAGFNQVDEATKAYDSTIINLPFEQLTSSYIPKQVQQLPGKVSDLLAAQSE